MPNCLRIEHLCDIIPKAQSWLVLNLPVFMIVYILFNVPPTRITDLVKLQLHDAIYRLRFYSNSLIRILSLSNSHNNVAAIQKNQGDKSHRVTVALEMYQMKRFIDMEQSPLSMLLLMYYDKRLPLIVVQDFETATFYALFV